MTATSMTLQQVDEVLKTWKERLSAVAENLMELQADSTYQSLTGTGGLRQVKVSGATGLRVGAALRTMNELFLRFGLLQSTVDKAEAVRGTLPAIFGAEAKGRELQQLLFGSSIELQASDVPLADRHLLSGARTAQTVTPDELLASMTRTFAEVRDAVAEVGRAWTQFAAGDDRVESELRRLRSQAAMPSRLLAPALDEVEAKLADTRKLAQNRSDGSCRYAADAGGAFAGKRQSACPCVGDNQATDQGRARAVEAAGAIAWGSRGRCSRDTSSTGRDVGRRRGGA